MAREGTEKFPGEAQIWSLYAALLHDNNQPAENIAALTRLITIDPNFPGAYLRRGLAYLESLQMEPAIADFRNAAQKGDGDQVAGQLLNTAAPYLNPMAPNFAEAEKLLTPALEFATSAEMRANVSYYLGSSIYGQASALLPPVTPSPSVAQLRQALAHVERAIPVLEASTNPAALQMVAPLKTAVESLQNAVRGR
jgi:tetratricopeptide (TPR) repeat protein